LVDGSADGSLHVCGKKFGDAAAYQSALFDGLHAAIAASPAWADQRAGQGIRGAISGKLEGFLCGRGANLHCGNFEMRC